MRTLLPMIIYVFLNSFSLQDLKDLYGEDLFGQDQLVVDSEYNGDDEAGTGAEGDDDSNEEDNWRYDYPSDDPDEDEEDEKE